MDLIKYYIVNIYACQWSMMYIEPMWFLLICLKVDI